MRILAGILIGCLLVLGSTLAYAYSGLYEIAATDPHNPLVRWAFQTTMERSVSARAEAGDAAPEFTEAQVEQGMEHFRETCAMCHGAPGTEPSEIGKGLKPSPPKLSHAAEERSPAELFWIVKHGIKMTGMPAFGLTHEDADIWAIVAFLDRLPEISERDYQKMAQASEGGHEHQGEEAH